MPNADAASSVILSEAADAKDLARSPARESGITANRAEDRARFLTSFSVTDLV